MAVKKALLNETRIRQMTAHGFGWVDRRFVRDGYIADLHREAILLYFFLAAVSDERGLSFYADPTIRKVLKLDHSELLHARSSLMRSGLIAYRYPLYQLLALPSKPLNASSQPRAPRPSPKDTGSPIAEITSWPL